MHLACALHVEAQNLKSPTEETRMADKKNTDTRPAIKLDDLLPKQPVTGAGTRKRTVFGSPDIKNHNRDTNRK
jgi:hypothetical protein